MYSDGEGERERVRYFMKYRTRSWLQSIVRYVPKVVKFSNGVLSLVGLHVRGKKGCL